ncbi:radial spoke head 1 homolog [Orussus abietinus]|uniref:radial spoke head 1 homolog n=1 Tax=Orussus abietinus TaxID=222816 RepID=UPI000C716042|nr:radial spoke head 1 homolog [Orussus abietinus]
MPTDPEFIRPEDGEDDKGDTLGTYKGQRNLHGERHGKGQVILPNGDKYVGSYCKGLRYGKGLYVFKNGARYEGEWKNGLKDGRGTFWYPDGTYYDGEWRHDMKHGFGLYCYMNKDTYEGSWKRNRRHGLGTYIFPSTGAKFMGTWVNDRMEGSGQIIHPRHRFHGSWEGNVPFGTGCYTFENKCMQLGHVVHVPDPDFQGGEKDSSVPLDTQDKGTAEEERQDVSGIIPLKKGVLPLWRARTITPYNPDKVPADPAPLQEEDSLQTLEGKCESSMWLEEDYLKYPQEYYGEGYLDEEDVQEPRSEFPEIEDVPSSPAP